jgi:hypothetical protein
VGAGPLGPGARGCVRRLGCLRVAAQDAQVAVTGSDALTLGIDSVPGQPWRPD